MKDDPPVAPSLNAAALEWLQRFLRHLATERRSSSHTASNYARDLNRFGDWCASHRIEQWTGIDAQHIRSFAASEHRRGQSPRSIQRRLSAVRSFFHFLIREGVCKANPAVDVQAPKAPRRLPKTLDVDQMSRVLDAQVEQSLDIRDKAIVELLYSSGLRLAELVGLDLVDLDLNDRTVRVLGKGRKERIVPVGRQALEALQQWLRERTRFAAVDETAIFISQSGRRISPRNVQTRVRRWAQLQGVSARLHPHLFRHSFASHLLESSHDLRGVQELLGHANLSTTQIYTHLDFQHLAKIYDAAHPRARRKR